MDKDFDRNEYLHRWARAHQLMEQASLEALLVGGRANYRYLSGHRSVQFTIEKRPMLLLLPLGAEPSLLVYGPEADQARAQAWIDDVEVYPGRTPPQARIVGEWLAARGLGKARLGLELGNWQRLPLPYLTFQELGSLLPDLDFQDGSAVLQRCRMVKSEAEVARIAEACQVALRGHQLALTRIHAGLSVAECERICQQAMLEAGADADPPPILSFGSFDPQHIYQAGDVFQLDFAISHRGYRADLTRRASFGTPSAPRRKEHQEIAAIQDAVLAAIRPGAPVGKVVAAYDRQAQVLDKPPLAAGEWIGHGVGLELLEPPALDLQETTVLEEGMVLTPEPWFISEGLFVMVEETVLVTPQGSHPLAPGGYRELAQLPG